MNINNVFGFARMKMSAGGEICLITLAGSRAFGLADESSDTDWRGVFVRPLKDIVGLKDLRDTQESKEPDVVLHELRKFCKLAVKGNPTILETLFSDEDIAVNKIGFELQKIRESFLWEGSVKPYFGYAGDQVRRMTNGKSLHTAKGKYNTKYAVHIIRLLHAGIHLAKTGKVMIRPKGKLLGILKRIKAGQHSFEAVLTESESLVNELNGAMAASKLPEAPNEKTINDFLYATYSRKEL